MLLLGETKLVGSTAGHQNEWGTWRNQMIVLRYEYTAFQNEKLKEMDHSTEKWTMYFLDEAELTVTAYVKSSSEFDHRQAMLLMLMLVLLQG